jgi:multiple sugar transport system substrate-binding protein
MNHMLAAFATAHPDITVQATNVGFGNMAKKITTAIAGGAPPNVYMDGDSPDASANGVLGNAKSVDAMAKQDGITADLFLPALQPTFIEAGKMWGLRFNTDVRPLYYNVNAFQEVGLDPAKPPTTWDELIAASQKLTKKGPDGALQRVGWWPGYGQVFFQQLIRSNGGHLSDVSGSKVLFDDDSGVGVLDFVRQAANAVGTAAEYATFAKTFGSNAKDPFITGQVAMEFNGSWLKQTYAQYGADLNYRAALLPFPKKQISISGGFTLIIPAANPATKDDASWQLLKYLCTDKTQQLYMAKTGQLSGLVSLADDPYFQSDPILKVVADQMKSTSLFTWQPPLSKLSSSCADAVKGAIANTAPSKQLLDTAAQLTQAAIDQYNQQNPQWLKNFGT